MSIERVPGGISLIDVLDRVLDKGIVVDVEVRDAPVGIDLIIGARVVVASIQTDLTYSTFGSVSSSRSALRRDDDDDGGGRRTP